MSIIMLFNIIRNKERGNILKFLSTGWLKTTRFLGFLEQLDETWKQNWLYVHILCKNTHQIYFSCLVISLKMKSRFIRVTINIWSLQWFMGQNDFKISLFIFFIKIVITFYYHISTKTKYWPKNHHSCFLELLNSKIHCCFLF